LTGNECFCGNLINTAAGGLLYQDPRLSDCNKACVGNISESCGQANRIAIYSIPAVVTQTVEDFNYLGCYYDTPTINTLRGNFMSAPDMTLENCRSFCIAFSFNYFGTENGM
jgi:hypothetical protein